MKMWCNNCGAEVTTANAAAIKPCPKCGSTTRQSWKQDWSIVTSGGYVPPKP